jgi:hypothetical protein
MSSHATGPRSAEGKERSSLNAVRHGLRSERPVLPGEDADEWDAFRDAVVADLGSATLLEHELAERAALQLWRLRRAARYEAETATDAFDAARRELALGIAYLEPDDAPSRALLLVVAKLEDALKVLPRLESARDLARRLPELPGNAAVDPVTLAVVLGALGVTDLSVLPNPCTAGNVRRALGEALGLSQAAAVARAAAAAEEGCRKMEGRIADLRREQDRLTEGLEEHTAARQRDQRLLQKSALDRVVRYEAHVSRQLNQALQLLRQFQAERRAGEEAAQPARPVPETGPGTTAITTEVHTAATTGAPAVPTAPGSFGNRDGAAPGEIRGRTAGPSLPPFENQFVRPFVEMHPDKGLNGQAVRRDREEPGENER